MYGMRLNGTWMQWACPRMCRTVKEILTRMIFGRQGLLPLRRQTTERHQCCEECRARSTALQQNLKCRNPHPCALGMLQRHALSLADSVKLPEYLQGFAEQSMSSFTIGPNSAAKTNQQIANMRWTVKMKHKPRFPHRTTFGFRPMGPT